MDKSPLVCSAAGRYFEPGMLYSTVTEQPVTGIRLWRDSDTTVKHSRHESIEVTSLAEDTFKNKANFLDISGSLKLSIMAGLIKLEGSAKYLTDKKSSYTKQRVAVLVKCQTQFSEFIIPQKQLESFEVVKNGLATHLVTGVTYGGSAVFVFEKQISTSSDKQEITGSLEACIQLAVKFSGKIEGELTEEEREKVSNVSCSFYGDFNLQNIPRNFTEAVEVMKSLPKFVADAKKCVSISLTPLSAIIDGAPKLARDISLALIDDVGSHMQELENVLSVAEHFKGNPLCQKLRGIREKIDDFSSAVITHKLNFTSRVKYLIPKIRENQEGEDELMACLNASQSSLFSPKLLSGWMEDREYESRVLQVWLKQLEDVNAMILLDHGDLVTQMANSKKPVLLINFPSSLHSSFIPALHSHNKHALNGEPVDHDYVKSVSDHAWCRSDDYTEVEAEFLSLMEFLQRNKEILRGRIFVSEMSSDAPKKFSFQKLLRRRGENNHMFELPSVPLDLKVEGKEYNQIELSWKPPHQGADAVTEYKLQYKELNVMAEREENGALVDLWTDEAVNNLDCKSKVKKLKASSKYAFRVCACTPLGNSDFSDTVFSETKEAPKCAIAMKDSYAFEVKKKEKDTFPGNIYELRKAKVNPIGGRSLDTQRAAIDSFDVGDRKNGGSNPQRVMLIVGETGCGKTTLLDGLANAYYKVDFKDNFRFKLVNETLQPAAASQTQKITVYTLNPVHGNSNEASAVDFPLVLIDTPGFGDTRGLEQDRLIVKQISDLLSGAAETPGVANLLHGIGFVVKASQTRLTSSQTYVFDQVLSMFGKDMEEIFMPLITFADSSTPQVVDSLKADNIPGDYSLFRVNNCMLFADNRTIEDVNTNGMDHCEVCELKCCLRETENQWEKAQLSYARLLKALKNRTTGITLQMTTDVLKNRQQLETAAHGAHSRVQQAMIQIKSIIECIDFIRTLNKSISHAELHMKKSVTEIKLEKVEIPTGQFTTLCLVCNRTCHKVCYIARDEDKHRCAAMSNGSCRECPQRCSWDQHHNATFVIEVREIKKEVTVQELFNQFQIGTKEKDSKLKLIAAMLKEYETIRINMAHDISTIHKCLESLDKLALRQYPLSVTEYVDLLIKTEEQRKLPGWEDRVSQFKDARQYAEIISKAREGKNPLEETVRMFVKDFKEEQFLVVANEILQENKGGGIWTDLAHTVASKVKSLFGIRH